MGLVLSGEDLIKIVESHTRSTCKKVNSQVRCQLSTAYPGGYLSTWIRNLHQLRVTSKVPLFY